MNDFIAVYKKILYKLFCAAAVFIGIWLSFFIEPFQSHHGNMIFYFQSDFGKFMVYFLLAMSALLILSEKDGIKNVFSGKADLFLWAYFGTIILGLFFRRHGKIDWHDSMYYISSIIAVYYFFKNGGRFFKNANKIACFICILGNIVALVAITETIMHKSIIYEYFVTNMWYRSYLSQSRAMATQVVPAVLGTYFLACIPMAYFIISNNKNRLLFRVFGVLSALLCITGLVLSFSRGSFFGLIFMTAAYFYKHNKKIIIYFILGVLTMIFMFMILKGAPKSERFRFGDMASLKDVYSTKISRAVTTYNILNAYPFFGLGLFNYRGHFNNFSYQYKWNSLDRVPDNMHLMILGENGALGYLFFLLFIIFLLKNTYSNNNEICITLSASIIGILVNMVTYDLLYWAVPFFIFWIYSGWISALDSIKIPNKEFAGGLT